MAEKEIIPVKLSNEGFAGFFEDVQRYGVKAYRSKIDRTIKFKLTVESSISIINNPKEFGDYIAKLNKMIKSNKINQKDKVFFSSNSVYPRTSFNRYSDSARRIENVAKADKIVVGNVIPTPYVYSHVGIKNNGKILAAQAVYDLVNDVKEIVDAADALAVPCNISKAFENESHNYYGYSYDVAKKLKTLLLEEFMKQLPTAEFIAFGVEEFTQVKHSGTLQVLKQGYPLTSFITDLEVSRYIDSFKDVIDATSYPMLLSALSGDNKQVTLAMKLIENMNTIDSKPYLYALFVNAVQTNRNTIINNKTYKSVGFNNVLETFNIKRLLAMHDPYSSVSTNQNKLSYISNVYSREMKSNEDKKVFLDAVEDAIEVELRGLVGGEVYDLLIKREKT